MLRLALTTFVLLIAVAAAAWKFADYLRNPWTRDGQVRAQVIQVTPRVTGPVVELPIVDNQAVAAGDLLFRIDPRTYAATLAQAEANVDLVRDEITSLTEVVAAKTAAVQQIEQHIEEARANVESANANEFQVRRELDRVRALVERGDLAQTRLDEALAAERQATAEIQSAQALVIQAQAALAQAQADLAGAEADLGASGDENARLRAALASLEAARLDFEFTEVRASVDGWITNLKLRHGSQAVADQPALALVDRTSFWVDGYFRETLLENVSAGDPVVVTLMTYPDRPITGRVDSIGWGIATPDGTTGEDLLPEVTPTFQWIRLAQRIPVRIALDEVPETVELRVGTTASVLVMTGDGSADTVPALPALLQ
ncbi:MAG: HlyD family secretion protein [Pseudomonadota bacterium]